MIRRRLRVYYSAAEYIDRPITEVAATMLHEMTHLCNLTNKINDVSNNRYYHNKRFKETAEAHGLVVAHHEKYGSGRYPR